LRAPVTRRAMLAGEQAPGKANYARQARRSVVPSPTGWRLGVKLMTPSRKKLLLRNHEEAKTPTELERQQKKKTTSIF
jgi:hypothetical protein